MNYIPLEKRSKKEQKAHHAKQRGTWGDCNPVTRKPINPKAYQREKSRKWRENPHACETFCFILSAELKHMVERSAARTKV
jgi:hypothetical protein